MRDLSLDSYLGECFNGEDGILVLFAEVEGRRRRERPPSIFFSGRKVGVKRECVCRDSRGFRGRERNFCENELCWPNVCVKYGFLGPMWW
jgi:hypothetical protein